MESPFGRHLNALVDERQLSDALLWTTCLFASRQSEQAPVEPERPSNPTVSTTENVSHGDVDAIPTHPRLFELAIVIEFETCGVRLR